MMAIEMLVLVWAPTKMMLIVSAAGLRVGVVVAIAATYWKISNK